MRRTRARRSRRRYRGRKRTFSRRKPIRPKPLTRKAIEKALQPNKDYIYETMFAVSSTIQTFRYHIPHQCVMMSGPYMHYFMQFVDEQGVKIGGNVTYTIDGGTKSITRFLRPTMKLNLRNVSNHGCFVDIYECLVRDHRDVVRADGSWQTGYPTSSHGLNYDKINEPADIMMKTLTNGWFETAAPGTVNLANNTFDSDDIIAYTSGGNSVESFVDCKVKSLLPYSSKQFVNLVKIVSKRTIYMQPGDDFYNTYTTSGIDYQPDTMYNNTTGDVLLLLGNCTKFLMFRQHGDIGKDSTGDINVGYMSTDIAYNVTHYGSVYTHDYLTDVKSTKFSQPTISGTLEGPTVFDMDLGDQ